MTGIEVGQGVDSFQEILEEREKVRVGLDQNKEQVQIETALDASHGENVIFTPSIVQ